MKTTLIQKIEIERIRQMSKLSEIPDPVNLGTVVIAGVTGSSMSTTLQSLLKRPRIGSGGEVLFSLDNSRF